jgi:hypothetical protein
MLLLSGLDRRQSVCLVEFKPDMRVNIMTLFTTIKHFIPVKDCVGREDRADTCGRSEFMILRHLMNRHLYVVLAGTELMGQEFKTDAVDFTVFVRDDQAYTAITILGKIQ